MFARRFMTAVAALGLAGTAALAGAPSASAHGWADSATGTRSLAAVLAKDGAGFDRNWNDFDIVDNAVTAVLTAKPGSAVGVLADGTVRYREDVVEGLDRVPEAFRGLLTGANFGKLLVRVSPDPTL